MWGGSRVDVEWMYFLYIPIINQTDQNDQTGQTGQKPRDSLGVPSCYDNLRIDNVMSEI